MSRPEPSSITTPQDLRAAAPVDARQLDSRALLGNERELWINHHGELYRLRLTRAGKLILTK